MDHKELLRRLPDALLPWYAENKRDLPWRADRKPYHIWLSEIMLQQTRVEAVKGYYTRFLTALPTVEDLANCPDDTLHKLWEGLGYYSRVRNLKKAAIVIMEAYGGVFPGTYEEIISLPGIGAYTAGAVCSIAFGMPTPAVDGNVQRARLAGQRRTLGGVVGLLFHAVERIERGSGSKDQDEQYFDKFHSVLLISLRGWGHRRGGCGGDFLP